MGSGKQVVEGHSDLPGLTRRQREYFVMAGVFILVTIRVEAIGDEVGGVAICGLVLHGGRAGDGMSIVRELIGQAAPDELTAGALSDGDGHGERYRHIIV